MGQFNVGSLSVPARRRVAWAIAAMFAALAVLLVASSPAHALAHRGHTFGGSFGEAFGEGDKLSGPSAVAVNEASSGEGAGDVYVLDSANNRVVRFGPAPEHAFLEAWGYGVSTGSAVYERCTSKCKPGIAGFAKQQFDSPVAIAIDNASGSPSKGDVYVVANRTWKHAVVDKFNAKGEYLATLIAKKEEKEEVEGGIVGVAVDQSGTVWVEREDLEEEFTLQRFNDEAPKNQPVGKLQELEIEHLEGPRPARPGFAVDAQGNVYVTYEPGGKDGEEIAEEEEEIKERETERKKNKEELKHEKPQQPCVKNACLTAKLAVTEEAGRLEVSPVIYELDGENSTGVAVDQSTGAQSSGDVFLDNAGSVAALTSGGSLVQRFGSGQLSGGGSGLAVDARTGEVLVADASAGRIEDFVPSPPAAPTIELASLAAAGVTATSASLKATIDATGADTHYRFQYGTGTCSETPSPCGEAPAAPGGDIGQGFGDQVASVHVAGLTPSTTYHIRVIAENQFADGAGAVISEERTFTTQSSALGAALPDGRAWELVSPPSKDGATVEPISAGGGLIQSAGDGRALTYLTTAPVGETEPEGNRSPEPSQIISSRVGPGEWSSRDIATRNGPAVGVRSGLPREYEAFSTDLGAAIVEPPGEEPLSPEATEWTVYLRENTICASTPSSCFQPLVTASNDTAGTKFRGAATFRAATPDLQHVVLQTTVALTAGAHSGASLYEWSEHNLQLISLLPDKTQATGALSVGAAEVKGMMSTAISTDGSRVVFHTGSTVEGHLYLREVAQGQTLQIDEPNTGVPAPTGSKPAPEFQTASADGSKVFFTDPQRLTATSTAPEGFATPPSDLYVFEADKPAGERLTDLTVDLKSGEGAGVRGGVIGSSEDGSLVYFVANGVLAQGASPGACRWEAPLGTGCNLYVVQDQGTHWGAPELIARLSSEDSPDWGRFASSEISLKDKTSRVSPNGEYVEFMSNMPLTGYNNTDQSSGAADEEVFLYHRGGGVTCVSCNPSGAQPHGVLDTEESGEGIGLLVDRPTTWGALYSGVDHWLAASVPGWTAVGLFESRYQSRYLSNSGRLFFNSADSLVPRDVNGKEDVYQYEPTGVGGCTAPNTTGGCVALISSGESEHESTFMDASESGNDVYFMTGSKLSPQDTDGGFHIYDARVCASSGAEPCPTSPAPPAAPCSTEACKPPPSGQPSYGSPSSATFSGSGNLPPAGGVAGATARKPKPPTRAQLLSAALKKCHKLKQKKKRLACEKQARKRYGATKVSAKKSSSDRRPAARSSSRTAGGRG
jgi:hypothetical protein